jgi:hypothetical protein
MCTTYCEVKSICVVFTCCINEFHVVLTTQKNYLTKQIKGFIFVMEKQVVS